MFWLMYEVDINMLEAGNISSFPGPPTIESVIKSLCEVDETKTLKHAQELAEYGMLRDDLAGSMWFLTKITQEDLSGILTSDLRWNTAKKLGLVNSDAFIRETIGGLEA